MTLKIDVALSAYEILLLRGALYTAAATGILDKGEALELSRRLGVERGRFPKDHLAAAREAFIKTHRGEPNV